MKKLRHCYPVYGVRLFKRFQKNTTRTAA